MADRKNIQRINYPLQDESLQKCFKFSKFEERDISIIQNEILILKKNIPLKGISLFHQEIILDSMISDCVRLISKMPVSYIIFLDISEILNLYNCGNGGKDRICIFSSFIDGFLSFLNDINSSK